MKIKLIFLIVIAFLITSTSFSQTKGKYMATMYYNMSFNIGPTHGYISNPSFAGLSFDGMQFVNNKTAIGMFFGWNIFSKQESGLNQIKNGAVYGDIAKYYNYFPLLATVTYLPNTSRSAKTKAYFTFGVGAYDILQQANIGVNTLQNNYWHFGLAPEIGVMFQVANTTNLKLSGKFNYAFDSGTSLTNQSNNYYSWFNINFGLGYNSW